MNLNPGDPCRVRLHDGRVVEAVYDEQCGDKEHFVYKDGIVCLASKTIAPAKSKFHIERVRFVGPSCVLETV